MGWISLTCLCAHAHVCMYGSESSMAYTWNSGDILWELVFFFMGLRNQTHLLGLASHSTHQAILLAHINLPLQRHMRPRTIILKVHLKASMSPKATDKLATKFCFTINPESSVTHKMMWEFYTGIFYHSQLFLSTGNFFRIIDINKPHDSLNKKENYFGLKTKKGGQRELYLWWILGYSHIMSAKDFRESKKI